MLFLSRKTDFPYMMKYLIGCTVENYTTMPNSDRTFQLQINYVILVTTFLI